MEQEIIVEYELGRCIGTQKCIEAAARHFTFDGEKAHLLNSKQLNGRSILQTRLTDEQLSHIKQAAISCPVNAIKVSDIRGNILVSDEIEIKPELRTIQAKYDDLKEFVMDEKGYFLIRINQSTQKIEVAFCAELNKITVTITGEKPLEIYQTILKQGLISRMDHAAYLGRELQKAYIALQKNIPYVQDDELVL